MSDVPSTATIIPIPQARECSVKNCELNELLARVEPDHIDEHRILCPIHRVEWLRGVADQ